LKSSRGRLISCLIIIILFVVWICGGGKVWKGKVEGLDGSISCYYKYY
jgi:hypothetical protein